MLFDETFASGEDCVQGLTCYH